MITKQIQKKGLLVKLWEKGIKILIKKECNNIGKIKIDIVSNSIQIFKSIINKLYINAEEINYKGLLFDKIELEANDIRIKFKILKKELKLENNPTIKLKISLSENSLKTVLFSNKWKWITYRISEDILDQEKLEDIEIKNGEIILTTLNYNKTVSTVEKIDIKAQDGNLYLENQAHKKSIKIPIEEKVFIKNVNIKNNLINIFAKSSISF